MTSRQWAAFCAGLFALLSFVFYGSALRAGFVADDWNFLLIVSQNPSPAVLFEPLAERYFRPLVVFVYWANYQLFDLWVVPYHVSVVLAHAAASTLFCLLVTALSNSRTTGLAAALLFAAFAGHSEAVAWIGGAADVLLAVLLFGGLVCLVRGLQTSLNGGGSSKWLAAAAVLLSAGVFAKETGVVAPLLGACVAGVVALRRGSDPAFVVRSAAFALVWPVAIIAAYLLLRGQIVGSPIAAYDDLATSSGFFFSQLRAFVLRVFLPAYSHVALAWARGHDVALFAVGIAALAAALWRRRDQRILIVFSLGAIAVSLAPALPLTVSLNTTETERVVYIPTAFGAMLTVLIVRALVASTLAQRLILSLLIVAHAAILQRFNRNWVDAGRAFDSIIRTFVETVRAHDPGPAGHIFLLNFPDNVRGAYVFRRGFYDALHFSAPDLEARHANIIGIDSHTLWRAEEPVAVAQTGANEFILDVSPNRFLQTVPPVRPFFEFLEWTPHGYRLRFTPAVARGVVLKVSGMQASFVADVRGLGSPIGNVDLPEATTECSGSIRFSGWALDDERVEAVRLEITSPDGSRRSLGEATWASNTRPDVAAAYAGFPHLDRTEWNRVVTCAELGTPPVTVRAIASDRAGHATEIGARRFPGRTR